MEAMKELDASSTEEKGAIATRLNQIKRWLISHSQHLNFFTILVLASVSLDFLWLGYRKSFVNGLVGIFKEVTLYMYTYSVMLFSAKLIVCFS